MPNLSADGHEDALDGTSSTGSKPEAEKHSRPRGLLPQALEELQISLEELRVADAEMRVQNDELGLALQRLGAERQRYQDLFEFAPDGYLVTNLDGVILEANRAAARLLGISSRFLKKRNFITLIAMPHSTKFQAHLQSLATSGAGASAEWIVPLRHRPSGFFPAAVTAARYQGMLDQPETLRWLIRDITERQKAEEGRVALARAEAARTEAEAARIEAEAARTEAEAARTEAEAAHRRTATILETITDQFVALDSEWRILSLNSSAARMIQAAGHDPATVLGKVIWDAYPTALGTPFQLEALRAVETKKMVEFEAFSEGLRRWLHVRVFPEENGVSVYANDVTERKDAEAALRAAFERERRIAETLQQILLHTPPPETYPSLIIETFYEAASEEAAVGGDFSDVFTYDSGKIALVVGDISGKGLSAATLIAEVKYALRTILREHLHPETALARLNNFFCDAQLQGDLGSDHQVVLSLAVFDPKTNVLSFLTAGGEPLLLLREDGTAEPVGTNGLLLGVQPGAAYTAAKVTLVPGDTVLLVTDGLTEARKSKVLFGFEGLQAHAGQFMARETLRGMGQDLIESVRSWAGGVFHDDVCLLLARCLTS